MNLLKRWLFALQLYIGKKPAPVIIEPAPQPAVRRTRWPDSDIPDDGARRD